MERAKLKALSWFLRFWRRMDQSANKERQATAQWRPELSKPLSAIRRYGLAVLSVSAALGVALLLEHYSFHNLADPLFLCATAIAAWYSGAGPAIFASLVSFLAFDYFFIPPIHSLYMTAEDIPHFVTFVLFASLLIRFAAVRRRVEQDLLQSRDELEREVVERTQQASLLNLTHDTIFVRDMNNVITYWNRGAQELYGWTAEEAVGRRSLELLHTAFPTPIEEIRAELLRSGRWDGELERTRSDGTQVVVSSRWSLRRNERERPAAILETNTDISERKKREREISTLNEELGKRTVDLEASNKELEAFAYSVSHDLRAPLRHMAGFTELLQKNAAAVLDERSQRYVIMILDSAKRMGVLIDDLLAFSRIGRAEIHKTMVSLEQLVQEALAEVRQETGGRNIVWRVGALPAWYGDRSMLRLVLVNLVSNAAGNLHHTRIAPPKPRSKNRLHGLKTPDRVVVFVRDNGVGFDMKYVNKLFGVFQRLHTTEAFEGTGIGLATVQRVIHRHGGSVWAEGAVDAGATFYFSLSKPQGV